MESPSSRLARVLIGFILSLMVVVSILVLDEDDYAIAVIGSTIAAAMAGILLVVIIAGRGRPHGVWLTDSWISREPEDEMLSRLERERDEASMKDLGSKWARMVMEHLEIKHSEE